MNPLKRPRNNAELNESERNDPESFVVEELACPPPNKRIEVDEIDEALTSTRTHRMEPQLRKIVKAVANATGCPGVVNYLEKRGLSRARLLKDYLKKVDPESALVPFSFQSTLRRTFRIRKKIFSPKRPPPDPKRVRELIKAVNIIRTDDFEESLSRRVEALNDVVDWPQLRKNLVRLVNEYSYGNRKPEQHAKDLLRQVQAALKSPVLVFEYQMMGYSRAPADCAACSATKDIIGVIEFKKLLHLSDELNTRVLMQALDYGMVRGRRQRVHVSSLHEVFRNDLTKLAEEPFQLTYYTIQGYGEDDGVTVTLKVAKRGRRLNVAEDGTVDLEELKQFVATLIPMDGQYLTMEYKGTEEEESD